jgi:mRNA-degrading endonuclease HigB of HigAB toxin-antitoxin module
MKQRNSDRDSLKLLDWQEYVTKIDFNTPNELVEANGVDQLFVFDNTNAETGQESLRYILEKLGE